MQPVPIKVHVREEKDQNAGVSAANKNKQEMNNSYHDLMTNIRVRSKTSLEASQEDNKSKGHYLYDLDIEQKNNEKAMQDLTAPVETRPNDI
jgi:hypothetical protein